MVVRIDAADEHTVSGYVVTVVLEDTEKEGVTIPSPEGTEVPSFLVCQEVVQDLQTNTTPRAEAHTTYET